MTDGSPTAASVTCLNFDACHAQAHKGQNAHMTKHIPHANDALISRWGICNCQKQPQQCCYSSAKMPSAPTYDKRDQHTGPHPTNAHSGSPTGHRKQFQTGRARRRFTIAAESCTSHCPNHIHVRRVHAAASSTASPACTSHSSSAALTHLTHTDPT